MNAFALSVKSEKIRELIHYLHNQETIFWTLNSSNTISFSLAATPFSHHRVILWQICSNNIKSKNFCVSRAYLSKRALGKTSISDAIGQSASFMFSCIQRNETQCFFDKDEMQDFIWKCLSFFLSLSLKFSSLSSNGANYVQTISQVTIF